MKLAVVGGGSTYTPELIDGFARLGHQLMVDELVLIDPAAERLELVGGVARRILARHGHPARVTLTTDLDAGVTDADAVLLQLRVGGQDGPQRRRDVAAGVRLRRAGDDWRRRAGQGAAHGPGGARHRRARGPATSPDAWIIDFTNPVGIVTRALLEAGHRAFGLCNVAIGFQRRFAALLGVTPAEVALDHVGLNHLTWERAVRVRRR